jgi:hypothetical protein
MSPKITGRNGVSKKYESNAILSKSALGKTDLDMTIIA